MLHPTPVFLTEVTRTTLTPGWSSCFSRMPDFCVMNTEGMGGSGCPKGLLMMMRGPAS